MKKFRAFPIKKQLIYAFSIITFLMIVVSLTQLVMLEKAEETDLNIEKSKELESAFNNVKYDLRLDQQMVMEFLAASSAEEAKFPQENHNKAKKDIDKNIVVQLAKRNTVQIEKRIKNLVFMFLVLIKSEKNY